MHVHDHAVRFNLLAVAGEDKLLNLRTPRVEADHHHEAAHEDALRVAVRRGTTELDISGRSLEEFSAAAEPSAG
eukprot:10409295-Alexandrium_andersonii.AAC.1